jgi:hypothetical protein
MATKKKETKEEKSNQIVIVPLRAGIANCYVLGTSPLIMNRMAEKARQELLLPRAGKMTKSDKIHNLKHDPLAEYRSSTYAAYHFDYPTRLVFPARAFAKAIADTTLDIPGATKAQILRLTSILTVDGGLNVPIYGIPQLFMSNERMSDQNRTPDIRTRAILPKWACQFDVRYFQPWLNSNAVLTLLSMAGLIIGVGDRRHQKSGGSNGAFELVEPTDERFLEIVSEGGKEAQDAALQDPAIYDKESEDLFTWFGTEIERRERLTADKKAA